MTEKRAALFCALLLSAGCAAPPGVAPEPPRVHAGVPAIAPSLFDFPWSWTDEQGQRLAFARWRGSPLVVTTFYTTCSSTCPRTVEKLRAVYRAFRDRGISAEFVLVTLDPTTDTPERLRALKEAHRLPAEWHLVQGDRYATRQLADYLGIHVLEMEVHLVHDTRIAVFDGSGAPRRSFACCDFEAGDALL
jgi:protein SCO1/2